MTYEQSEKMINLLKNTINIYNEEWVIYFHFTNESHYEVRYFKMCNWVCEMKVVLAHHRMHRLPYGCIFMQDEQAFLLYRDINFYHYAYNLTLDQPIESYVLSDRVADWTINNSLNAVGIKNFMSKA